MARSSLMFGLLMMYSSLVASEVVVQTLPIGAKAPDFNLLGVDGRKHALKDFDASKILVVIFACNHCPTAQAYEGRIQQLVTDYEPKGVAVVVISPNDENSVRPDELGYTDLGDSFEEMKIRARDHHFNYPYLYEGDKTGISRAYGPTATPDAFVFDAGRKLRYVGRIDDSERVQLVKVHDLRNALDAMLAGRPVPVAQTKAFGCSIKWSDKAESVKEYNAKLDAAPVTVEPVTAAELKALRKNDSNKLRLVNFWATWCGPCLTEFDDLVTIDRMYDRRAFEMVTVSANFPDEKKDVIEFLKKERASTSRNLLFATTDKYDLMDAFDPQWNAALPYTMLIAPGGEVLYNVQGSIDPLKLKRIIVKSLKEDRFK